MSDSNLPPEQWRPLFDMAGIEFGYRPLANHIGTTHTRVRRVLRNEGTSEESMREVADALRVPVAKVRELRGEPAIEIEPFTLPDEAGRLTHKERDVIRAMVRVLLEARSEHALETAQEPAASAEAVENQKTLDSAEGGNVLGETLLKDGLATPAEDHRTDRAK